MKKSRVQTGGGPGRPPAPPPGGARPTIDTGHRNLAEMTAAAWEAMRLANGDEPKYFASGSQVVMLVDRGQQLPTVLALDFYSLRRELATCTDWMRFDGDGHPWDEFPVKACVETMLSYPNPPLPALNRVVGVPVLRPDGTLLDRAGYDAVSGLYLYPTCDVVLPDGQLGPDDIAAALAVIDALLCDFPFVGSADRALAFATLLEPFVRETFEGPTPLRCVDAVSGQGTGKDLLATTLMYPFAGREESALTEGSTDDEWRKRLTAALLRKPTFIYISNVQRTLDSAALAAALTTTNWEDRILGQSRTVVLPNRSTWIATGNGITTSRELRRRVLKIVLDARQECPWLRTGFRHNLVEWRQEHRGEIVGAALTLATAWVQRGRPLGTAVLGSYERWAATMGGILDAAGVPGFLENLGGAQESFDEETRQLLDFLRAWWATFGSRAVTAGELRTGLSEDVLPLAVSDGFSGGQTIRLGKLLVGLVGRHLGGVHVALATPDRSRKLQRYRLETVETHPQFPEV